MTATNTKWLLPAIIACTIAILLVARQRQEEHQRSRLAARLQQIVPLGDESELSCREVAAAHPLVLLAIGQSNAGNHGARGEPAGAALTLAMDGKCVRAGDPLPGGSGRGGSIWQRVPAALREQLPGKTVVFSVLAVDASSIAEWTDRDGALSRRLVERIDSLRQLDLAPDFVLWQQGEADARQGTSGREYARQLDALAAIIGQAGVRAPILVARSTICRSEPNAEIRHAIESKAATDLRFRLGPDMDLLAGNGFRDDGCHLSVVGLETAARMWAASISAASSATPPAP